ncbi:MAG: hypothetical protein ACKVS5_07600 [Parvularculaceae bacterium]
MATLSDDGIQYGAGFSAAFNDFRNEVAYSLGARFESALEEAERAIICLPAVPGVAPTCVSGSPAAPARKESVIAYAELRKAFSIGEFDFGVAPRVTRNFKTDATGVSVPVYYVPGAGGGLTGGVAVGWRDDTKDVTVGIFIGGSFDLFN